jgi:hypothetical protein
MHWSCFSIQAPAPDQERFFRIQEVPAVASSEARWVRTLQHHPWTEVFYFVFSFFNFYQNARKWDMKGQHTTWEF